MAASAGTAEGVDGQRDVHRLCQRPGHPLRHIIAAFFAGGRHRDDDVIAKAQALHPLGCWLRAAHENLAAKEQPGHLDAQLHGRPRLALVLGPQHRTADTARVAVGCRGPAQGPQIVLTSLEPHGHPAERFQPFRAFRAGWHKAQHPAAERAAAGIQQLPACRSSQHGAA